MEANTLPASSCPSTQTCNYYSELEQGPISGVVSSDNYNVTLYAKLISITGPVGNTPATGCTLTAHIGNVLANSFPIASLYSVEPWQQYTLTQPVTNLINGVPSDPLDLFWLRFECGTGIAGLVMVDQVSLQAA
jgi:hypothetical protein